MIYAGQSIKPFETRRLITGNGNVVGDIDLPGMLHAGVMRGEYAHASLKSSGDGATREAGGLSDDMADDANGRPLTASLMDAALLRASAMPA